MLIALQKLEEIVNTIALKYVSKSEARYCAQELVQAYVRKYPRCNVLAVEVIADTKRQEKFKNKTVETVFNLPGYIRLDFHGLPMTFYLKWLHDLLIKKAEKNGIAMAAFDNGGGMHTLHTWSQGIANRGYFAFGAYNGGAGAVVPFNGTKGILGTNPTTYAFPTASGSVVVDMATSEIPYFEFRDAKENNERVKPGAIVDQNGEPTTDPKKAEDVDGNSNILPIGGSYKGYAINYLFEIMTATLIGAKLSPQQDPNEYRNEDHGGFLIVIKPDLYKTKGTFASVVDDFNALLRSQKARKGTEIIVPGDNNLMRWKDALEKGEVEVDEETWQELQQLAL